ncbi:hypothetical protein INR49_026884 [Caranx melampygus]|nr:hypothetical protein INR49_026884 [Caranx melampygus]
MKSKVRPSFPSPFFSLSSVPNSCTSTNRLLSSSNNNNNNSITNIINNNNNNISSSSHSIIPLSSLSPTCPPLLSSRSPWAPLTPPHPLPGPGQELARWGHCHLWIPHTLTPGNKPSPGLDAVTPPSQSCNSTVSNPPDMSGWNPFGEDNFSKLTEEELIDREFDMLRASKWPVDSFLYLVKLLYTLYKPVERTASVETDRPQPTAASAAKPLPPEDLFGSVPFVASAGKS